MDESLPGIQDKLWGGRAAVEHRGEEREVVHVHPPVAVLDFQDAGIDERPARGRGATDTAQVPCRADRRRAGGSSAYLPPGGA